MNEDVEMAEIPPKTLRRYFALNPVKGGLGGLALLEEGRLWFSNISNFNDPFDTLPRHDVVAKYTYDYLIRREYAFLPPGKDPDFNRYLRRHKDRLPIVERRAQLLYPHKYRAAFASRFGVVCFCGGDESVLMLAHYADGHRGFVVELDYLQIGPVGEMRKVVYSNERVHVDASGEEALWTKSPHWSYEAEYRLIVPIAALASTFQGGVTCHYLEVDVKLVRRVYLGWLWDHGADRNPNEAMRLLKALSREELSHVEVVQMEPAAGDYSLIPRKLEKTEIAEKIEFLQSAKRSSVNTDVTPT